MVFRVLCLGFSMLFFGLVAHAQESRLFGYDAQLVFSGDDFSLYEAYFPKSFSSREPLILVVHNTPFGEKVDLLVEVEPGRYEYKPSFLKALSESDYMRGRFLQPGYNESNPQYKHGNGVQIHHFARVFDISGSLNNAVQSPLMIGKVENQPAVRENLYSSSTLELKGWTYSEAQLKKLDVTASCTEFYTRHGKSYGEGLKRCGGKGDNAAQGHPLAYLELYDSQLLYDEPKLSLYTFKHTPDARTYFAIVHKVSDNEPILQYEDAGVGSKRPNKAFGEKLLSIPAFVENMHHGQAYISHYVKGAENPVNPARENFTTELTLYAGDDKRFQFKPFNNASMPLNTKREWVEQNRELAALAERQANDLSRKLSETDKEEMLIAAEKKAAALFGYIWKPDEFWEPLRQFYQKRAKEPLRNVTVQYYFDGLFEAGSIGDGALFVWPMFRYIENVQEKCPSLLGVDYVLGEIITTSTTVDASGRAVSASREIGRRQVKIPRRFADAYGKHFERFQTYQKKIGAKYTVGAIMAMYNGNNSDTRRAANMAEPMWGVDWVFKNEPCNSPIIEQLGENLARAADGRPSIQAAQVSFNGKPRNGAPPATNETFLYHERAKSAVPTYHYSSSRAGWTPGNLSAVVEQAEADYGKTLEDHFGQTLVVPVNVVIHGAPHRSLREIRIHPIGAVGVWPSKMHDRGFDLTRGSPLHTSIQTILRESPNSRFVECEYRGGSVVTFWLDATPAKAQPSVLRAVDPKHIYLNIKQPQTTCPSKN